MKLQSLLTYTQRSQTNFYISLMCGASSSQNGHHAVQKTTTAGCPRRESSETCVPSVRVSWKSGATLPTCAARRGGRARRRSGVRGRRSCGD